MSCFQVSDNHISAIIGYACRTNLKAGWGSNPGRYAYTPGQEQEAFDLLFKANQASVQARYGSDDPEAVGEYQVKAPQLRPIEVIKAIDSLAYQCDEWEGFVGSDAQAILRDIREKAIGQLPGYAAAAWSIS